MKCLKALINKLFSNSKQASSPSAQPDSKQQGASTLPAAPLSENNRKAPPWYVFSLKFNNKKETDPEFNKEMSKKWKLFGMNLGTISQNWAAWCGLAAAVTLAGVGLNYPKDGALAKNWDRYGVAIDYKNDGLPQGAFARVNHQGDCKSEKNNHITQVDGDCAPQDLKKSGATFNGRGGNQQNTWKVSTFPVAHICSVRWPADYAKPPKITTSKNCTSGKSASESTR